MNAVNSVKELNFLGNPIDFVGFKGLDGDDEVEIKFIEVKSGKSKLNKNQRRVKAAVLAKKIQWVEVRINNTEIEGRFSNKRTFHFFFRRPYVLVRFVQTMRKYLFL